MAGGIRSNGYDNRFSIRDIENLTGIKAHTIRIWEQRYGILQPKRTPTNIRYYDTDDLKLALRIGLLNNHGYKISNIHKMNGNDMNSMIEKIADTQFKRSVLVNEMLEAMLDADVDRFENYINDYTQKHNLEEAVEKLIFLFLEKIGLMWMTDRIFPAQEHLVSNIIYRKIALAIENLPAKKEDAAPTVLLFLPEGEMHDMGLLYVQYLLRKAGKNPIYLGANSPLIDAHFVYEKCKPAYIYIHLTSVADEFDAGKYLHKAAATFPKSKLLASGSMLRSRTFSKPKNLQLLFSLAEVKETLLQL